MRNHIAVVILAAGKSTRMHMMSKPMSLLAGTPVIEHVINQSLQINDDVLCVVNENKQLQSLIKNLNVKYIEQTEHYGTAAALNSALPYINTEMIFVRYVDVPLIALDTMLDFYTYSSKYDMCILAFEDKNENIKSGVLVTDGDIVLSIKENSTGILHNAGLIIKSALAHDLIKFVTRKNGEYLLTDLVQLANDRGHKCGYYVGHFDELQGFNNIEELNRLEAIFQQKQRRQYLNSIHMIMPETIMFPYKLCVTGTPTIYPHVCMIGQVSIGDNSVIYPCSVIDHSSIGAHVKIGSYARIKDSKIDDHVIIGHCVELNRATIGKHTKAKHLSYIGDSKIGHHSNIGAGVVICNYDGYKKHMTHIGNGVSIGANSSIIAPRTIGNSSIIGAGSVITSDVMENDIAISRSEQHNIPDGAIRYAKSKSEL